MRSPWDTRYDTSFYCEGRCAEDVLISSRMMESTRCAQSSKPPYESGKQSRCSAVLAGKSNDDIYWILCCILMFTFIYFFQSSVRSRPVNIRKACKTSHRSHSHCRIHHITAKGLVFQPTVECHISGKVGGRVYEPHKCSIPVGNSYILLFENQPSLFANLMLR